MRVSMVFNPVVITIIFDVVLAVNVHFQKVNYLISSL